MKSNKLRGVFAAVSGVLLLSAIAPAMADSNDDIIYTLMAKGVLTEEEGHNLLDGRDKERTVEKKAAKSAGKIKIAEFIDSATVYGDIRVRAEERTGSGHVALNGADVDIERARARYKLTLGVKTEAGSWYTDLALAMGANGRSDNATFGKSATANINDKETLFVKRAMVGYKATDWLTVEAGRMDNPLYTTPMVWDADLNFEGLTEKFKYNVGAANLFLTMAQAEYQGDKKTNNGASANTITTELFAFQGGGKLAINDRTSAKAALTYTHYSHNTGPAKFSPQLANAANATVIGSGYGVNDLDTIEVPGELNFMATSNVGMRVFGDYVYNTSGSDRCNAAGAAVCSKGNDDTAWLLGLAVGSAKDLKAFEGNKMAKGDWSARLWYQDVGAYSVDPNAVDSDFMDSRVNMQGTVFKAQYNVQDNVLVNFAAGHATRKNDALGSGGAAQDLAANLKDFDLFQLDLTYKF